MKLQDRRVNSLFIINDELMKIRCVQRYWVTLVAMLIFLHADTCIRQYSVVSAKIEMISFYLIAFTLYWKKQPYAVNTQTICNIYQISSMMIIIIIIKMGLAMQGREREIATRSVRRPRPHSSVGVNESVSILRGEMTQVFLVLKFKQDFGLCTLIYE